MADSNISSKRLATLALFLLFSLATAQPCPSFCRFRWCFRLGSSVFPAPDNLRLGLRPPGRPQGVFPCMVRRNGRITELRNVVGGEASVSVSNSGTPFVPISEFADATPRFQATYFSFAFFEKTERESLVRRQARGNQRELLRNLCGRLPIRSHDILRRNGSTRRTVMLSRARDCVGFRTRIDDLDIELFWDTSNDLNLRVIEPDGFQINRDNRVSPSGGALMLTDQGADGCTRFLAQDRVRYRFCDRVQSGGYIILIDNINECSPVTIYTLRVTYKGRTMVDETDSTSRLGLGVGFKTFQIPWNAKATSLW